MSEIASKDRSDMFGLLMVLLFALTVFYLVRPPVLLFLRYDMGLTGPVQNPDQPRPASTTPCCVPRPIAPVPLPSSLTATRVPTRWTMPISSSLDMTALNADIFTLTNDERVQRKLDALSLDPMLAEIAARHSRDMVDRNYHAHVSPEGDGPAQRVGKLHRTLFGSASENVAFNSSLQAPVDRLATRFNRGWMNSLGHRRNILSSTSNRLGVGCSDAPDAQLIGNTMRKCTQLFARAFAYAESPIPEAVDAGDSIFVRLTAEPGHALPVAIIQTDLLTDRVVPNGKVIPLTNRGGIAAGQLQILGPPGLYGLSIHVPVDASGRYSIVSGPYVRVR